MTSRRTDPKRTRRAVAVASVAAFALAACNIIAGLDREYALVEDAGIGAEAGPGQVADAPPSEDAPTGDAGFDARKTCPSGRGPEMVPIEDTYCIDSTEVTQAQYAAFLAADAGLAFLPDSGACAWKESFSPREGPLCRFDGGYPDLPVVCVDWCDAYAFCAWAGKRLCGAIDGGAVPWEGGAETDPDEDEWYRACSRAGTRTFPYGDVHEAGACRDWSGEDDLGVVDAGSKLACQGGYEGIWDMVGNAWEFEDSCSDQTGGDDLCKVRGGSWAKDAGRHNRCVGIGRADRRSDWWDDFGIRCCAD